MRNEDILILIIMQNFIIMLIIIILTELAATERLGGERTNKRVLRGICDPSRWVYAHY